ncbi:MAG: cytochrome-c oxidase, cbb3-type subunit III [Alphaproteobacteria bacterium]
MSTKAEQDAAIAKQTTGHEWDGIREYDTPLPKWWVYVFYVTIVVAIAMFVLYPSVPGISGYYEGVLGRQERSVLDETLARAAERQAGNLSAIAASTPTEINADPQLREFAMVGGRTAFADNCAPCHGLGGGGQQGGYPVLVDDDWLWGGTMADIEHTIRVGIRGTDAQTRTSVMPAFGQLGMLDGAQIGDVADYVLSLSGQAHDTAAAERGAGIFAEQCAACHGADGAGMQSVGAPSLRDQIWLYGSDRASIMAQIDNPRLGVMPTWQGRLDDATIKMLTVYVHNSGGGQ